MAKKFSAEYTAEDIMSLYKIRKEDADEARLRTLATTFRELCRMEHTVSIPEQYRAITPVMKTPFMRDAWLRIGGSLVAKSPIAHITPKDDKKQEYRESANIAERFDAAMLERNSKDRGKDLVINLTLAHVRDGESVLKVVHRPDAWANFPSRLSDEEADDYKGRQDDYKRGADLPVAWSEVDRLSMLYEGGEYGDLWCMEYGEYTKPYLKSKYRMVASNDSNKLVNPELMIEGRGIPEGLYANNADRSVKVEFFTSKEWHVIIDGTEAPRFPRKNPYSPYLPYFRAPAHESESLLYSLLYLVPRMDELLTMKLNWSYLGAYPNPVLKSVPNSNAFPGVGGMLGDMGEMTGAPNQKLTWTPGKLMDLPVGRELEFLTPPPVGQDLNDLIVILKSMIDIAGVPSVMRGAAGAGDAGYLYNQMMAAATMMYRQSVLSCQRQLEKATEFTHWLIQNVVKQTVYVMGWDAINTKTGRPKENASRGWLGLSPDSQSKSVANISKLGPVSFQYRPTLPTDEQARAMIALQLTNSAKPLYSKRDALERWMQEEDADAILENIAVEEALEAEPLKSMILEEALRDAELLPPPPPEVPQMGGLVDQFGQPLMPPGMGSPIPMDGMIAAGGPSVPGVNMPIAPTPPPQPGIPGAPGGRVAGSYPGQPSGPNM